MEIDWNKATLGEAMAWMLRRLMAAGYERREADNIVRYTLEELKGWTRTEIWSREDRPVSEWLATRMRDITRRLCECEPLQYILGTARFYGLSLGVTPAVLIPRPETEQLVELVTRWAGDRPDLRVLDAGTGSGAIAIALARQLRFPRITALDASPQAVELARANAANLKVKISFRLADMLNLPPEHDRYDIIVSNPPYVLESEKLDMEPRVLLHEPQMALFVPDNDAIKFYTALARYGKTALSPKGLLAFEINPLKSAEILQMLTELGYEDAKAHADMSQRTRFITAIAPDK